MARAVAPTEKLARAHEAAVTRLTALLRQLERIHRVHATRPAPPELAALAAQALGDAGFILGGRAVPPLPAGDPSPAVLATHVGQALAGLETYQATHAAWNIERACCCWTLRDGKLLPVARLLPLRPRKGDPVPKPLRTPAADGIRQNLLKLIDAKYAEHYDRGYRDAREGKPHPDEGKWAGPTPRP